MKKIICIMGAFMLILSACSPKNEFRDQLDVSSLSWPIYRGDANLSGVAKGELSENLDLLWSFQTGDDIKSSPVVGYGRVYVGSTDGKLYALAASNGDSLWAFDGGDDIEAPPLLFDSTVYIGTLSGDMFALHAATGAQRWKYSADGEIYGSANIVDAPDGRGTWLMFGSYDFNTYCLDAKTGERQWSYEADNYINGSLATNGEVTVFGGCDELLHIIAVADGKKIGEVVAGSYVAGSPALIGHKAYLGHYGEEVMCIDVDRQNVDWRYNNNGEAGSFFSTPAVNEKYVVIGSRDKLVHCVDRKTGGQIWTFKTRDDVDGSPVICGDKVIVGSNDGRLYILNLEHGQLIWSYEIGSEITGSPAVTGGLIFVGAEDGRIYAFGESL